MEEITPGVAGKNGAPILSALGARPSSCFTNWEVGYRRVESFARAQLAGSRHLGGLRWAHPADRAGATQGILSANGARPYSTCATTL